MTLLYTLTVGTLAWWMSLHAFDSRYAMGIGAPWAYGAVFAFVLAMAVLGVQARRAARASPTLAPPRFPELHSIGAALLVALPIALLLSIAFGAIDLGGFVVLLLIGEVAMLAVPLAWIVGSVARRWHTAAPAAATAVARATAAQRAPGAFADRIHAAPDASGRDVLAALAPLLVPLVAMILLRCVSAGAWWEARTDGPPRAGILHVTLIPLMLPVAIVVAWSLDRLDGSRGGIVANGCALLALAALVAALWLLPQVLIAWQDDPRPPRWNVQPPVQLGNPFHTVIPDDPPGSGTAPLLPLTDFFRASALMMLLAAAVSAQALRRLGRGVRTLSLPRAGLIVVVQVLLTLLLMPRLGMVGAPLAASAALAVGALLAILPIARRSVGTTPAAPGT